MASSGRKNIPPCKRCKSIPYVTPPSPQNDLMRQAYQLKESATMVHVSCDGQPIDALNEEVALTIKPKEDLRQEVVVSSAKKGGSSNANANDKSSIIEVAMASSTSGQVKLIVDCSSAIEKLPNFQVPSLDAVVKLMEDKCRKQYKDVDPNFSVKKVMEHVCQCFLEMSAKSSTTPNCSSINSSEASNEE